jgi:hypothetical protein
MSLIRFSVALLLAVGLIGLILPAQAAQNTPVTVRLAPANASVAVNQTVDVAVEVVAVSDLYGLDVSLQFDPQLLEVVDVDPALAGIQIGFGTFLDPGFVLLNEADNEAGTARLAMTQLNPSLPQSGTGNVIVVRFRGRQVSSLTPVRLTEVQLAGPRGQVITAAPENGAITVLESPPPGPTNTPIPTQPPGTPFPTRTPLPSATPGGPASATPPPTQAAATTSAAATAAIVTATRPVSAPPTSIATTVSISPPGGIATVAGGGPTAAALEPTPTATTVGSVVLAPVDEPSPTAAAEVVAAATRPGLAAQAAPIGADRPADENEPGSSAADGESLSMPAVIGIAVFLLALIGLIFFVAGRRSARKTSG